MEGQEVKEPFYDTLAERYASPEMVRIWHPRNVTRQMRAFWVEVLTLQKAYLEDIPDDAIAKYRAHVEDIDLDHIAQIEVRLRHDVKANIEAFDQLAGYQLIHRGLTSRDVTDNVEQNLIRDSIALLCFKSAAFLNRLSVRMREWARIDIAGRTHLMPAQTTTVGKRFATIAEEFGIAFSLLERCKREYPLRSIKGPVGTQQDQEDLLGSGDAADELDSRLCLAFGAETGLTSVGQVYPRSLDFQVVSALAQLASAPGNLAKSIRLMAGLGLGHEGFGKEQVGSSAMPHKRNSRTCERINGLCHVLNGYLAMVTSLLGDQWFEGDVSCSVVRRIALRGAFLAMDSILESAITVLDEMEISPGAIKAELDTHLPFLSTTALLVAATKAGMGREDAHRVIREHALAASAALARGGKPELVERLAADTEFVLSEDEIRTIVTEPNHGQALEQVAMVAANVEVMTREYGGSRDYSPAPLL